MWDGNKRVCIGKALVEADIAPEEFKTCWNDKVKSLTKTKGGKKQLLKLLEKGGFREQYGNEQAKMRQKIMFVNAVVGRKTSEPAPTTSIASPNAKVCTQPCIFHSAIVLIATMILLFSLLQ